ncbi:DUF7639 domain-containing protein [Propionibacteriaceae bacterium Y1923]|uniref:DUF7639 domain-containing protein n=1 Tax=Aestuariimicrobium sp. Y1814 TaxID=3418742 RepID=UPI003C219A02
MNDPTADDALARWHRAHAAASMVGWDFSRLDGRMTADEPWWDLEGDCREALATATSALDLGTGGCPEVGEPPGRYLGRMSTWTRTYRPVEGERVDGVVTHVLGRRDSRGGHYFGVTNLEVYADGSILPSGPPVADEEFVREVADQIERLNGRPTSRELCRDAAEAFAEEPSHERWLVMQEAYLRVPAHLRPYVLSDMDVKDQPIRVLLTPLGGSTAEGVTVTEKVQAQGIEYFCERRADRTRWEAHKEREFHEFTGTPTVIEKVFVRDEYWPQPPAPEVLHNNFPRQIVVDGQPYPTVTAAFHALQRPGAGPDANLALMAAALRAKYTQHKDLTKALLATDGRIEYANGIDGFWTSYRGGRNWIGRLLELVRAELRARR